MSLLKKHSTKMIQKSGGVSPQEIVILLLVSFFFNKILYQYLQLEYEGNNAQNQHFWSFFSNKVIEKKFCKVLFDNHIPHLLKKKKKRIIKRHIYIYNWEKLTLPNG